MENVWITLITVLGGIVTTLVAFLIKNYKEKKQLKERESALKELTNYIFGQVDMILQDKIIVKPEIRDAMRKASKRYHSLDLVKEIKDTKENNIIKK